MKNSHSHTKVYFAVWIALMILTVITVKVSYYDFGSFNILVAMLVATFKALLVCLFFMHLKYDNKLNQVTLVLSIIFIFIFVSLTLSDVLFRPAQEAAVVKAIKEPEGNIAAKMLELSKETPELIARGQKLFSETCVRCHGAQGNGDGEQASSMNPRPRNFHALEGWKNGRAPSQIFLTLKNGVKGSNMSPFFEESVADRWAVVHYVHSLTTDKIPDTPATLEAIGIKPGQTTAVQENAPVDLPLSFAVERFIQDAEKKQMTQNK